MILHSIEAGQGPPLVLLHGLFGAARNFGAVQRALAPESRVIALDLRNHGSSPHEAIGGYDAMAADVLETLETLAALPATVLGHSMGGKVAMRMALGRPDAVAALIVADIAPVTYEPHLRPVAAAMAELELTPGLTRAQADAALAANVPEPGMRGFLLQNLTLGAAPSWRIGLPEIIAAMPAIEAWPETGQSYAGPTLFLAGERSNYIRREYRTAILQLFPAARFVTLKDAGHWLHADNQVGFIGIVQAFLASREAGSGG